MDVRAGQLQGEYERKARAADRTAGTAEGEIGPVQQRLAQFPPILGLVFGAFGEGSEDIHQLINVLSKQRVMVRGLREGRMGSGQELAEVTGQFRRLLSTAMVRANAGCLLARMGQVGDGVDLAGKRRRWAASQEEKMRGEREACWLSVTSGRSLVRRGQFFMN